MSIVIESKRKELSTQEKMYPSAIIVDVTSHSGTEKVKFSLFYPHGGILMPFIDEAVSISVEGIWQGVRSPWVVVDEERETVLISGIRFVKSDLGSWMEQD